MLDDDSRQNVSMSRKCPWLIDSRIFMHSTKSRFSFPPNDFFAIIINSVSWRVEFNVPDFRVLSITEGSPDSRETSCALFLSLFQSSSLVDGMEAVVQTAC